MADTEEDLSSLTVAQLKEKLKKAGLPVSGNKADLVKRLQEGPKAEESAGAEAAEDKPEGGEEAAAASSDDAAKKAEEEAAAKKAEEEAAAKKAEEEAAAKKAEEAKRAAEAEAARKAVEAAKKAEAARKAEEDKKAAEAAEAAAEAERAAEEAALDPAERKRRAQEAKERQRKADKRKKLKEKKKATKAEEAKEGGGPAAAVAKGGKAGKGASKGAKGKPGKGGPLAALREAVNKAKEDEIEVDYVVPEVLEGSEMEGDTTFAAIMERFKYVEPETKEDEEDEEDKPKKRTKPKASLLEEAEDSDEEGQEGGSKKKRKLASRMSVAELKTLVKRPDVVELWDTTASDPRLLVYLKAYRNSVNVPKHWASKRKYMAGKRGVEKPPFKLPEFIEATGIAKIRQAIIEKQADMSFKQRSRERVHPKMGKLDIDYQVLHDAFFKYMNKPKLTKHNDLYYEGKEYEAKMMNKRPGQLSAALKEALGMEGETTPPPWLINMQRYGPPPAYPNLKIPGLNAPIPQGAEYGYHPGGWGKPPVDEFGNPLYGDWKQDQAPTPAQPEDSTLWGEVDDYEEEEEEDEAEVADGRDGAATPMLGTATPLVGTGSATPVVSGGVQSISGVSSMTSGMDTPGTGGTRSKRGGIASVSGISSASLTPTPQLFQVLEEQKARGKKGVYPSSHTYKMGGGSRSGGGSSTPVGGVGSSGTGTPLGGIGTPIGGIGTPIGGIGTPHGISTPHGIGTPGLGTRTPHGISTPLGVGSAGAGTGTPGHGIGTPMGGIGTPMGVGGISTPVGGIATPVGGIATPVGGIATPVGGIATPVGGVSTPAGIATPVGGVATPTGIPGGMAPTPVGGADTPGPVTMSLNPEQVETEGILTADIIRQQLKQHEEAAAKAKLAAGQKEVEQKKGPVKGTKKRKDKTKFKF